MKLNTRKYGWTHAAITLEVENSTIDLGLLNNSELQTLLESLNSMVEDVEWLVNTTAPKET